MYLYKKLGRLTKEDFEMTRFQGFETKEVAEECVKKDVVGVKSWLRDGIDWKRIILNKIILR